VLVCAGYQKSLVSLRQGKIDFALYITLDEDAFAFADNDD
jgi:hypothetical protein